MMAAKMSRSTTAPPAPKMIALRRLEPSRLRAAMAITTALSPARRRSTPSTPKNRASISPFKNSINDYPSTASSPGTHLAVQGSERRIFESLRSSSYQERKGYFVLSAYSEPSERTRTRTVLRLETELVDRRHQEGDVQYSRAEQIV